MAFGGGGSGKVKSDINVTPLVDVVLVLLIIFLVAMPIEMKEITMDIPKKAEDSVPPDMIPDQLTVSVQKGGVIMINDQEVNRIDLATKLKERLDRKREKVVFVDFDEETPYGQAVGIMDTVKGAGATTVALKMSEKDTNEPDSPDAPASP
jgi:biopolymer transport protein TolR